MVMQKGQATAMVLAPVPIASLVRLKHLSQLILVFLFGIS
jgi:hypothetical protein